MVFSDLVSYAILAILFICYERLFFKFLACCDFWCFTSNLRSIEALCLPDLVAAPAPSGWANLPLFA